MRIALLFLKGLVVIRRFFVKFCGTFFGPGWRAMKWLGRKGLVESYRAFSGVKRATRGPASGSRWHVLYFFSGRWVVHVSMFLIALLVGFINISGSEVRAEGFGEKSLLFRMVIDELAPVVEEVTSETAVAERDIPDYFEAGLVSSALGGTDTHSLNDSYVTTTVGGAVVAPTLVESKPSVAPRTEVETYMIADGDTLGGIADRYGLSLNTLLWANGLSFRSTLKIGQGLTIPPTDGVIHTVKRGDTLLAIARKYGANAETIIGFNRLASANDLSIGESLIIPGGKISVSARIPSVAPVRSLFTGMPSSAPARSALPAGSGAWVWPADLRTITQYYGWRHTGVDIDCNGHNASTNTNYAAADGVVVYSGWRGGYGYTVEIDHGNGIQTRYGHNAELYVSPGQVVTAGVPLALCGTTGRSSGTHLHFEVIRGGRFANPLEYVR
ncbi:TPA: hypothetical protein DDZ10_04845 [Candidatus Uhrbacteria bacterium]|nr:hypothetical protein [Candidatus Uhrbacteria bacterium]